MHLLDWVIVTAYLVYVVWHGLRMTRGTGSAAGYFLAGRNLPWWAVGLSVMATQMSAITLVGTTGQAYVDGTRFIQFYYGLPLAMVILCVTAVPFFYRAKVFTAYEFLEQRFDARTRSLTSFCFLLSRGLGVGVIIAAPSVILSIVLGWDEVLTIFAIGLTTTAYTMVGGVQAVTWTDVKQMIVILGGIILCVAVTIYSFPDGVSLTDGLSIAGTAGNLETMDFSFNLEDRYTVWSGLFAALFLFLAYFGCDQSQVQRYLTARSVDEGRTSLLMSAFLKIPLQFLILMIGVLIFVFYNFERPPVAFNAAETARAAESRPAEFARIEAAFALAHAERREAALALAGHAADAMPADAKARYRASNQAFDESRRAASEFVANTNEIGTFNDVNYVFPYYVLAQMPMGLVGLIIAAIMAAAMSSVAAELNSLATASTMDFYKRHLRPASDDRQLVLFGRMATLLWGLFACVVATFATNLGSLIEVVNRFGSFFYGSLLGVFVLAFAIPRANGGGAFYGLLCGMSAVWLASLYTDIAFLWFNVIGCAFTVVAGILASMIIRGKN